MNNTDFIECGQCHSTLNKMCLLGKFGKLDVCPLCGASIEEEDPQKDWITWWYMKSKKYGDCSLWDKMPLHPEDFEIVKEFKAPPRDENGSEKAKEILRTYVPDAFLPSPNIEKVVQCPTCGSKEYTLLNKGYSVLTGFLGSGRIKRVCNYCKREF